MRLVLADIAGYREICEFWDLDEVCEANELLDIREDVAATPTPGGSAH